MPIVVLDVTDKEALELAIIENVQRADLNPLEEADGYQALVDEFSYSQADIAKVVGKSRSHVANTLRLLKLPDSVKAYIRDGKLSAGHARALTRSARSGSGGTRTSSRRVSTSGRSRRIAQAKASIAGKIAKLRPSRRGQPTRARWK